MVNILQGARGMAVCAVIVAALAAAAPAPAETGSAGKAEIERIVRDYLRAHPEIVIEAIEAHKMKQEAAEQAAIAAALKSYRKQIESDPDSPVGGNPSGDVTVVEFFDYRCGVCKRVHPQVAELTSSDRKIRRVYKDWPILGPHSVFAARAALASRNQGKYLAFHDAMMAWPANLTPDAVIQIARKVGLDAERLIGDMKDGKISEVLERNFKLADALHINGTPSFVIGGTLIRGARDLDTMRRLVAEARQSAKP